MQFKPIVSVLVAITYIVAARKVETYDSSPRHVVSFNFGWKFRLGLHHVPKPLPPVKPENITKCKENPFSQFTINASVSNALALPSLIIRIQRLLVRKPVVQCLSVQYGSGATVKVAGLEV